MSKPSEKILANYDTTTLRTQLTSELPATITSVKAKIRERREVYQEAEQARALTEAGLMTDISAEVDPNTGKAAYSNEKARAAELLVRKAKDEDYQLAEQGARAARWAYETAQDELDELFTRNRNYLAALNVIAAELNLIAAYEGQDAMQEIRISGLSQDEASAVKAAVATEEEY